MLRSCNRLYCLLILLVMVFGKARAQPGEPTQLVRLEIKYHSARAGEVFLVWAVDYWQTPEKKYWPKDTDTRQNLAYTRLTRRGNSFATVISLPYNSRIYYYFQVPRNRQGEAVTGWDTNEKSYYTTLLTAQKTIGHSDANLYMKYPAFSILSAGLVFFIIAGVIFCGLFFAFKKNRRAGPYPLVTGFTGAAAVYLFLARAEIAGLYHSGFFNILGSVFQDLCWLLLVGGVFYALLYIFKKQERMRTVLLAVFFLLMTITVLSALINIDVMEALGAPFSYRWLYYSDFLREQDTRAAIGEALSPRYLGNLFLLLASYLLLGTAIAIAVKNLLRSKRAAVLPAGLLVVFFALGFYAYQGRPGREASIQNPVLAFISSVAGPGSDAELLETPVPAATRQYLADYHNRSYPTAFDTAGLVNNIILFVSESTPQQFISLYDSTYHYTPALEKWSAYSRKFTNMYAHIPSTPNSMLSLISGIYPMVDYKSAISENIQLPPVSVASLLASQGWATALFFSSDLHYSKMDAYVKQQGFGLVRDFNTMPCDKKFTTKQRSINGLDDACLADNYLQWMDSNPAKQKFGMLWTNQTHYPYYSDSNTVFSTQDESLNRYLDALKHTDKVFDALMTGLAKRNQLNNTLVIFIGDHGEAFGTHGQTLHASRIYEENVHIPCLLFNPVLFNGKTDTAIHGLVDIDVTIAHVLGLQKPGEWQGRSLLDTTTDGRTFFMTPYADLLLGTRYQNWKYIYNADTRKKELYNLATDPKELVNLADQYPGVVRKEQELLTGWVQYVHQQYAARKK